MNIPKKISIIVKRGENLEYTSSLKKASKNRRWRVIFLGGEDKLASEFVDAENGCPTWDCEVTLDLVSPSDPVLYPTRKNSHPHGRLVYWIWAIDYWPPGTQTNAIQHSKSFRGSLSHLGSKMRSKSKHRSKSGYGNGYAGSELGGSTLQVPGMSYNPFENDGSTSEFGGGPIGLPPMYQSSNVNSPYAQSEFGGSIAGSTKSNKHRNIIKRFKNPYFQNLDKGSKSNLRGSQLSIGGTSYRDTLYTRPNNIVKTPSDMPTMSLSKCTKWPSTNKTLCATSQLDLSTQLMNERPPLGMYNRDDSGKSKASVNSVLDDQGVATPIQQRTDGVGEVSTGAFESPGSFHVSTWNAQPNDRPIKPIEDMTKREIAEYVNHLLKTLHSARTEITRLQMENDRLTGHSHETETELNDVRLTLATLRNRLLADNLTDYLELPRESNGYMGVGAGGGGGGGGSSSGVSGFMNNFPAYDNSSQQDNTVEPQSFLSKISSLGINARISGILPPSNSLQANGNGPGVGNSGGGWW
ncbi:unnamed protein product [Heterobilharzia americana]|nr:unnamed protein product [Heterobilharzia americana]